MHKRTVIVLSLLAACGILSTAYGQMFDMKPADKKIVPGINKIPPLLPVMSPSDFQSKVQSLSEETRTAMTTQGLDSIQQLRDALPTVKPNDPPPLKPTTPPDKDNSSADTSGKSNASAATPAAIQAPPAQNTGEADSEETDNPQTTNPSADNNTGSAGNNPANPKSPSPSGGGNQLNIQY